MAERICAREARVSDTVIEALHLVGVNHINPLGILHGGVALSWMISAATTAAVRVARGPAFIAHLDHVFFINPVHLGRNAVVTAWVDYVGNTSMELTTLMEEEDPVTGGRTLSTAAHMTYVAVDESLRPRTVPTCVRPKGAVEEELYERALQRRVGRSRRLSPGDVEPPRPLLPGMGLTSYKLVNPEDTMDFNAMQGGRLLHLLDELSGITAIRYARGVMVTAGVDATDFVSPIRVGDVLEMHTAITYVGRTSVEVTVKALTQDAYMQQRRHATTSYFTLVHLGSDGRPREVPQFEPREEWQRELFEEANERRKRRIELLEFFKREANLIKPPTR